MFISKNREFRKREVFLKSGGGEREKKTPSASPARPKGIIGRGFDQLTEDQTRPALFAGLP